MEDKLKDIETRLLLITREFLLEQEAERAMKSVFLNTSLERQLGIDSLAKAELLRRIEKTFGIHLPHNVMAEADTLQDIAKAVLIAKPSKKIFSKKIILPKLEGIEINLSKIDTLQDALIQHAIHEPKRPHIYLQNEEGDEEIITYGELLSEASSIANGLIQAGIKMNDPIAIMLPTDRAFFQAFFGVLLAGSIPLPIYPPFHADRIEEYVMRETKILNNAEAGGRVRNVPFAAKDAMNQFSIMYEDRLN